MSDKNNLNKIYESVYHKRVPQREKFVHKFNKLDDTILKEAYEDEESDDELSTMEVAEITMDYLDMVLDEGIPSEEALQILQKGWGLENIYEVRTLIKNFAHSIYAGNYHD